MTTIFIADLHLEEDRPEIAELFMRFLREHVAQAKALYILGDLFEIWIGDDHDTEFNQRIIQALENINKQGIPVYFMPGNRDFLISKRFLRRTGCHLLADEHLIKIADQTILLMHGDTLCTQDVKYLQFRKRSRNFFLQKLFLWKSLAKRKALAEAGRQKSREHTSSTQAEIMDVTQEEVERVMRKHKAYTLIHGHTHRPAVHRFLLDEKQVTRHVLAPWHEKGSALVFDAQGKHMTIEIG